jgi:CMP-N,N'-diacetyllegionaminic acid synthase
VINGKTVIAIIPARAGSKGLPGKNLRDLCGKPLIAWSIAAGLNSKYIDEVVLSTDSYEIAKVGENFGANTPFIRPNELATDGTPTIEVVMHALDFYKAKFGRSFDYTVLLEPTSPIREETDIDHMLEKIETLAGEFDAIISLGEVKEHPSIMKKLSAQRIIAFSEELPIMTRRQDNEIAYFPYGVAYISKTNTLIKEMTFYPERTTFQIIQPHQCFEIDDIYDFVSVEAILKNIGTLK